MENYIWPEITKQTPIEEIKEIHQKIWDYVVAHGYKPETPYTSDCVLCEYCRVHETNDDVLCSKCPVDRPRETGACLRGLYREWLSKGDERATEVAKQIRDIPFKFEKE